MSSSIPLKDLIESLAGAVIEAQDKVEQHQLESLAKFFDRDKRPKSMVMRVPSIRPDAGENEYDLYRAPLLPLVSMNQLKIKDVQISFDADIGQMIGGETDENGKQESDKTVTINFSGNKSEKSSGSIKISMKVEGSEPTDGAARLMNHLSQTQGVFRKG